MKVLLVDWLGRGGIAQTSESWALELGDAGVDVRVVTRADRELGSGPVPVRAPRERSNAVLSHAALCRFATQEIRAWRPDVVVIQNYVIPVLELAVHRAAHRVGARVVFVVHDHRHHEWREGGHLGLRHELRRADRVVVHTATVGAELPVADVVLLPLPALRGMLAAEGDSVVEHPDGQLLALLVGILNRDYKGTDTIEALARTGVDGWAFAFAGVGAPAGAGVASVDRFLDPGELVATVRTADAVVLPYRHATQSGAVVLAQLCGTVAVASAVGGLVEQIEDGVTGVLLPAGAGVDAWRDALERLRDDALRERIAGQAHDALWAQHEGFRVGIRALVGLPPAERTAVPAPPVPS